MSPTYLPFSLYIIVQLQAVVLQEGIFVLVNESEPPDEKLAENMRERGGISLRASLLLHKQMFQKPTNWKKESLYYVQYYVTVLNLTVYKLFS